MKRKNSGKGDCKMDDIELINSFIQVGSGIGICVGIGIIIVIIALIVAIFDIKSNTAQTVKELREMKQQLAFISKSMEYQNQVIAQLSKSSSGSTTPAKNNNRY